MALGPCLGSVAWLTQTPPLVRRTDETNLLAHFFSALSTPAVDNFVCHTMRDSCSDVWAANELTSLGECEAKLAALPLAEGDEFYFDGNT